MQFFESDGLRLAYVDIPPHEAEAGDPILLIHGFASNHVVNWVSTLWVQTLSRAGLRVLAIDNRGHGQSDKPHRPQDYHSAMMAEDSKRLLDHLNIRQAHVMGYSMGARIAAHLALREPSRVHKLILGGLGIHLVQGAGLPLRIAEAMEAPSLQDLTDPMERMFRAFAEQTKSDLLAMAACIRGSRQVLREEEVAHIATPTLIAIGSKDAVSGSGRELADLMPDAELLDIPNRDHNLAVGDKVYKQGVLAFLNASDR